MIVTIVVLLVALLAAALVLAWRADHKGTGRAKHIRPPTDDSAVGDAKALRYFRVMGGMGPTKR